MEVGGGLWAWAAVLCVPVPERPLPSALYPPPSPDYAVLRRHRQSRTVYGRGKGQGGRMAAGVGQGGTQAPAPVAGPGRRAALFLPHRHGAVRPGHGQDLAELGVGPGRLREGGRRVGRLRGHGANARRAPIGHGRAVCGRLGPQPNPQTTPSPPFTPSPAPPSSPPAGARRRRAAQTRRRVPTTARPCPRPTPSPPPGPGWPGGCRWD